MSSIVQRRALSLLKRGLLQNVVEPVHLRSPSFQRLHQISKNGVLSQMYFRSSNPDTKTIHSATQPSVITTKDEIRELMAIWPDIVRDLTDPSLHPDIQEVSKWMVKVLQYNVPGGKKTRALSTVHAYRILCSPEDLTEENTRLSRVLGWCTELLQGFFLVNDDIIDHSHMRRNQPCWHHQNGIGVAAINDASLLEMCIYELIKKYFKGKDCYLDLVELFLDTTMRTEMGQCLDSLSTNFGKKPNLDLFTMDRYNAIVKYKTSYYSFVLPVITAMHFAGINDPEMHRQAKTLLLEMGHFFQVQDDYLDVFGDPAVIGKVGTDIQDGKCSWLVVVALQRVTPKQRKILEECYGVNDPEKVNRVKQLYNEIGLPNTYNIYEEETYNLLQTHIQQVSRGLPHDLFLKTLDRLYRRTS